MCEIVFDKDKGWDCVLLILPFTSFDNLSCIL